MENPTPKYQIGDRIEVTHKNTTGEIVSRSWNEENDSWIYQVYKAGGDRHVGIYQEKNLNQ